MRAAVSALVVALVIPANGLSTEPDLGLEKRDGPDIVDVSAYTEDLQRAYEVFAIKCSKCHSLARPINARVSDPAFWRTYVDKMARRAGSGINERSGQEITAFLEHYTRQRTSSTVPANLQLAILLKVLLYDRSLPVRAQDGLRLGVVFDPANVNSTAERDALVAAFGSAPRDLAGKRVELVEVPQSDFGATKNVDVAIATVGIDFSGFQVAAAARRIVTFTGDETKVRSGIAIGVVARSGKPHLMINVPSAIALGMDLDPQILDLAEVVR